MEEDSNTPEEASTHTSAKPHTGTVFVPRVLDHLTLKINGFPGLTAEQFCVKFGDRSFLGF